MRAILLTLLCLCAGPALAQEKFVSSNMDVRTILNFKAPDAAIQKLVPTGWEVDAAASGPSAGANLRVTFIDQMAAWDATGKPTTPVRNLVFGIPAKKKGATTGGLMIFAGLSIGVPGPYGANMKAANAVERKVLHTAKGSIVAEVLGVQGRERLIGCPGIVLCSRAGHAQQGRTLGLCAAQARLLPHLPLRAGSRCRAQQRIRPVAKVHVQGIG